MLTVGKKVKVIKGEFQGKVGQITSIGKEVIDISMGKEERKFFFDVKFPDDESIHAFSEEELSAV
jgi:transcription antitermination factor NusG